MTFSSSQKKTCVDDIEYVNRSFENKLNSVAWSFSSRSRWRLLIERENACEEHWTGKRIFAGRRGISDYYKK